MPLTEHAESLGSGWIIATLAGGLLVAIAVAGSLLYVHTGSMLQGSGTLPPGLILALALVGGAASFFSPCSIAITPAFLTYLATGTPPAEEPGTTSRAVITGALFVALGIVVFYGAAGTVVAAVGAIAYNYLIYFVPLVGVAFLLLGASMLLERTGPFARLARWNPMNRVYGRQEMDVQEATASRRPRFALFGFAYGAASHTCSLPIFLGILLVPLVAGNYVLAAFAVFAYGVAIACLLVVMMVLGRRVFQPLRRLGPWLMRVTGVLFIGTGGFLFFYFARNYGVPLNRVPGAATAAAQAPEYTLTEGADPTGYPYEPRTLSIPVGRAVEVAVTDHVGGCLLRTVFEGLGPGGRDAEVTVPVGDTRVVRLYAARAGSYTFHCGGDMYSGTVMAR